MRWKTFLLTIKKTCRRIGNDITVNIRIEPISGWAAGRTVKMIKTMVQRAALDFLREIHDFNKLDAGTQATVLGNYRVLQFVNRLPLFIPKGHTYVPFSN